MTAGDQVGGNAGRVFVRRRLRKRRRWFGAFWMKADTHTLFEHLLGKLLEAKLLQENILEPQACK